MNSMRQAIIIRQHGMLIAHKGWQPSYPKDCRREWFIIHNPLVPMR